MVTLRIPGSKYSAAGSAKAGLALRRWGSRERRPVLDGVQPPNHKGWIIDYDSENARIHPDKKLRAHPIEGFSAAVTQRLLPALSAARLIHVVPLPRPYWVCFDHPDATAMSRTTPVYRLQLNRSASVSGLPRTCETPRDAYEAFKSLLGDPDREHLLAIFLDSHHRVLGLHVAAIGNRNLLHSEARDVFSAGLLLHATDLVLVHNHPSGDATPSEEDEARTRELEIAGLLLGITLLDHIVVGEHDYRSIRSTDRMLLPMAGADELTVEEVEERTQKVLDLHLRRARAVRARAKRKRKQEEHD